ncbi:MAG: isoaspartyl peptidase/L-asparaginase [Vicinamibacterales bacterium]
MRARSDRGRRRLRRPANADGVVQLDSCCMHGPLKRAGGVACIEGVRCPVARRQGRGSRRPPPARGEGAQDFARAMGFKIEDDLNTEHSRKVWLEWKRRIDQHYLDPVKRSALNHQVGLDMMREGLIRFPHYWGTINCDGINAKGEICGVTTTSGLAWKIPGRVGDSPILGAGLWVDNEVGAAGSTGARQGRTSTTSPHLIVELMRNGMHPKDAAMEGLKRIKGNTVERLLSSRGLPNFNISFYALNKKASSPASRCTGRRRHLRRLHRERPRSRVMEGTSGRVEHRLLAHPRGGSQDDP